MWTSQRLTLSLLATTMIVSLPAASHAKSKAPRNEQSSKVTQGRWQGTSDGCKLWNPAPEPNETVNWSGECVGGYASGYGTETWYKDGVLGNAITGQYVNGRSAGEVTVVYPNGSSYKGRLGPKGGPDGVGIYTLSNGRDFRVTYANGRRIALRPVTMTRNEATCESYGIKIATPEFRRCWMQLNQAEQQAELAQQQYQLQYQLYQQQLAAFEAQQEAIKKERDRRKWAALATFGFGMAASNSPTFSSGIADGARALNGQPPLSAPIPPSPPPTTNYTVRLPNGNQVYCSYNSMASYMSCR